MRNILYNNFAPSLRTFAVFARENSKIDFRVRFPSPVANSRFYRYHKNMKRLNPLNDYLFLKLMGEEGDEVQCLAFLNAVLGSKSNRTGGSQPVKLVKILENRTFTAEIIGEKTSILDVRVETDTGEKCNIEVQLKDLHHMEQRTLFYWGQEFTRGISRGDDYIGLPKVITINIVNFDNIKLDDFHTCFHLWEDEHKDYMLTDVLEIHLQRQFLPCQEK